MLFDLVSLSNGSICTLGGETELSVTSTWEAHDFEPWIAAFDCWEPNTVWTGAFVYPFFSVPADLRTVGGDDCKLKGWDLRQGCEQPTFVNKRCVPFVADLRHGLAHSCSSNRFEGGVTTIQSHPLLENLFAVGRYSSPSFSRAAR